MDIRRIDERLSVSPQIAPSDMDAIKAAGFAAIVCNRPDGEEIGQPTFAQIEAAATQKGLTAFAIPVGGSGASDTDIMAFADALADLSAPALAYCRTGTRSTTLWALSQAGHIPADQILAKAATAGYDLRPLASRLGR